MSYEKVNKKISIKILKIKEFYQNKLHFWVLLNNNSKLIVIIYFYLY